MCKSPGPSTASSALRAPPRGCSTACRFGLPPGLPNALAPPRGLMNPVAPPPGCRMLCHCLRWRFLHQLGKHKKVMENYFPGNVARLASTRVGWFSEKFPCRGSPRDPPRPPRPCERPLAGGVGLAPSDTRRNGLPNSRRAVTACRIHLRCLAGCRVKLELPALPNWAAERPCLSARPCPLSLTRLFSPAQRWLVTAGL